MLFVIAIKKLILFLSYLLTMKLICAIIGLRKSPKKRSVKNEQTAQMRDLQKYQICPVPTSE